MKSCLTSWDEKWLNEGNEEKWSYVVSYILNNWPIKAPNQVSVNFLSEQEYVKSSFEYLLRSDYNEKRGVIRKTKEAWRSQKLKKSRKKSGEWSYIKLTDADKGKLRKLAKEHNLGSANEVISMIISGEYKALCEAKKAERDKKALDKRSNQKRASIIDLIDVGKDKKLASLNENLKQELEDARVNLHLLCGLFTEQLALFDKIKIQDDLVLSEAEIQDSISFAEEIYAKSIGSRLERII